MLTPEQTELAAKALHLGLFSHSPEWAFGEKVTDLMRDNLFSVQLQLAKVGLAIQPIKKEPVTRVAKLVSLAHGWQAFAVGCRKMANKEKDDHLADLLRLKADTLDNAASELLERINCNLGCQHVEPYGWVPEMDCPVHDKLIQPINEKETK